MVVSRIDVPEPEQVNGAVHSFARRFHLYARHVDDHIPDDNYSTMDIADHRIVRRQEYSCHRFYILVLQIVVGRSEYMPHVVLLSDAGRGLGHFLDVDHVDLVTGWCVLNAFPP